jgi:hypothetical protein
MIYAYQFRCKMNVIGKNRPIGTDIAVGFLRWEIHAMGPLKIPVV